MRHTPSSVFTYGGARSPKREDLGAVGVLVPLCLPQQLQGHTLPAQLRVDLGPVRLGAPLGPAAVAPIEPAGSGGIGHVGGERPRPPFRLNAPNQVPHRGVLHPVGPGNRSVTQSPCVGHAETLPPPIPSDCPPWLTQAESDLLRTRVIRWTPYDGSGDDGAGDPRVVEGFRNGGGRRGIDGGGFSESVAEVSRNRWWKFNRKRRLKVSGIYSAPPERHGIPLQWVQILL